MESFSERLKALRKERKKTQQNIADFLGVLRSTYGEYERSKIIPPMEKMKQLADYFGVSVDYIFGNTDIKNHQQSDVADDLRGLLKRIESTHEGLIYNGEPLNADSREALISSLQNALKLMNIMNRS